MKSKVYILLLLLYSVINFYKPDNIICAQLDIGEDIDFEYRYMKRQDEVLTSEFRERIKLYLNGYLQDNIEVGAQFQSSGIMNSTETFAVFQGAKIQNLEPFFELAYIKINKYYGYPVSISFGKLPIKWADGILVNHNQLGLPSILIQAEAPYEIKVEAYHARTRNNVLDISGIKGYGLRFMKEFGFRRVELDYTHEKYTSTAKVKRYIYGANVTRNLTKGLEYNFFGYNMKGEKGGESFKGYALGAYGKFEGIIDPIGKGGAWIRYMIGSGDLNDDESGFMPVLSSVESSMIGDYYGRYREFRVVDSILSNSVTLSHSIANLSVFRQALYATARDDVSLFMIRSTYRKHRPSLPLGGSLTLGVQYKYSFINFEIRYTTFTPEDIYDFYSSGRATKFFSAGLNARF
jgi:hypothetical protein